MHLLKVSMIEHYNFNKAYNNSYIILSIWIPLFVVIFIWSIITMTMLNFKMCKGRNIIFWILFVTLCLPFFYNQIAVFLVCIGLFIYLCTQNSITPLYSTPNLVMILSSFTILFAICIYIITSFILYLYGTTTVQDLWYKKSYNSIFIPLEKIPIKVVNKDLLNKSIHDGKQNAKNKKVVFGLLARDIALNFEFMKERVQVLAKHFKEYKILIFENDSIDGSRELFTKWEQEDKNVILMQCCTFGACNCKLSIETLTKLARASKRIDMLRFFREHLLQRVQKEYSHYDYYIVIDFDLPGAFYLDGFFTSFEKDDWDMLFARGITTIPMFNQYYIYDSFAFIAENQSFDYVDNNKNEFFAMNKILNKIPIGGNRIKCRSGFNGIAIYKIQSIVKCSYYSHNVKFKCEHIDLHHDMYKKGFDKIYFNPNMILFAGHQGPDRKNIFWNSIL